MNQYRTFTPRSLLHSAALLAPLLLAACAGTGTTEKIGTVFYPPPPQTPRVQFLTSITKETDLGKQQSQFNKYLVGETGGGKQLARPYALAHTDGKIYVGDKTIRKVLIIDLEANSFDYIRDELSGALEDPAGIAITPDGLKYVADANRGQIVLFGRDNEFLRAYGEEGQFRPVSVAVRGDRIYVCDIKDQEIEVLDRNDGEVIDTIGGPGTAEGSFKQPTHVVLDPAGNLYVVDALNFRVQVFDPSGEFVKAIGYLGSHPGSFTRPKGLDVDRDNHLYVADVGFELMQIFDIESAEPLLEFGKYGPAPGATNMPSGVHIDYDNVRYFEKYADPDFKVEYLIYVGNVLGDNKLNVYGFGQWTGPEFKDTGAPAAEPAQPQQPTVPSLEELDTQAPQDADKKDN